MAVKRAGDGARKPQAGAAELLAWLNEHGVCKAVMEASGGL